jgi:hypothetical protein
MPEQMLRRTRRKNLTDRQIAATMSEGKLQTTGADVWFLDLACQ